MDFPLPEVCPFIVRVSSVHCSKHQKAAAVLERDVVHIVHKQIVQSLQFSFLVSHKSLFHVFSILPPPLITCLCATSFDRQAEEIEKLS